MTPRSRSGSIASNSAEWTPRSRWPAEPRDDRLGRRADAHLDGGAVRHDLGDVGGDPPLHLPDRGRRVRDQRPVGLDPGATRSSAIVLSPRVRGIRWLTSAITRACRAPPARGSWSTRRGRAGRPRPAEPSAPGPRRPPRARRRPERPRGVEVAERDELRLASRQGVAEPRHGVEGHPAEPALVLRRAERMPSEMKATLEGERAAGRSAWRTISSISGVGSRSPAAAGPACRAAGARWPPRRRRAGHAAGAPGQPGRPARAAARQRQDHRAEPHLAEVAARPVLHFGGRSSRGHADPGGIDRVRSLVLGGLHHDRRADVGAGPEPDRPGQVGGRGRRARQRRCALQADDQRLQPVRHPVHAGQPLRRRAHRSPPRGAQRPAPVGEPGGDRTFQALPIHPEDGVAEPRADLRLHGCDQARAPPRPAPWPRCERRPARDAPSCRPWGSRPWPSGPPRARRRGSPRARPRGPGGTRWPPGARSGRGGVAGQARCGAGTPSRAARREGRSACGRPPRR